MQSPVPCQPNVSIFFQLMTKSYIKKGAEHIITDSIGSKNWKGLRRLRNLLGNEDADQFIALVLSFHLTLLHHGMVIAGLPYSFQGQMIMDDICGCSPYGASTIAGADGSRFPSENELAGARYQGEYVAKIAKKLTA